MNKKQVIFSIVGVIVLIIIIILVQKGFNSSNKINKEISGYFGDTWTKEETTKESRDGLLNGTMYSLVLQNDAGVKVLDVFDYYRSILTDEEGTLFVQTFSGAGDLQRTFSYQVDMDGGNKQIVDMSVTLNENEPAGCIPQEGDPALSECKVSTGGTIKIFVSEEYNLEDL